MSWTDSIIAAVSSLEATALKAGIAIADQIQPVLHPTLLILASLVFIIYALKYILSDDTIMDAMQTGLMYILLLFGIIWVTTPANYSLYLNAIHDSFVQIQNVISGSSDASTNYKKAAAVFDSLSDKLTSIQGYLNTDIASHDIFSGGAIVRDIGLKLKIGVMQFILLIIEAIQMMVYVFLTIFVAFYFAIAAAFGPFALITYIFPPLSYIADGWLKFLLGVGVIKIIIAIVLSLYGQMLIQTFATVNPDWAGKAVNSVDTAITLAQTIGFASILGMLVLAIPSIVILISSPDIADKILSGSRVGGGVAKSSGAEKAGKTAGDAAKTVAGDAGKAITKLLGK